MRPPPRQAAFSAILALIVAGQTLAALDALGARWPAPGLVFVASAALSLSCGALLWRRAPAGGGAWWTAPVAWSTWAGAYYLVAWLAAGRASPLPPRLDLPLPLVPSAVLVYLGVHPLSLLPYLALPDGAARVHLRGQLVIVAASALVWWLWPVALPRQQLPAPGGSLGLWALATLRGSDPEINCFPSTHCAVAVHAAMALARVDRRLGAWAAATAAAIAASTMLTRQHYLLDVLGGTALGYLVHRLNLHAPAPAPPHRHRAR